MASTIQVRVDDDLKAKSDALFKDLGTDTTTAIRMFLTQAVTVNGFPFEIKRANPNPYEALTEHEILDKLEKSREHAAQEILNYMHKTNMTTLCYIENEDSYLMLHRIKKEHDVNKDKWIGVGGHFEPGESPEECLLREAKEETGLTLTSYRFRGIVTFIADQWQPEYMCLYTADGYEGEMISCQEGQLEWVKKDDVLGLNLWEGDKIFFQLMTDEEPFFSLKLRYEHNCLMEAALDGKPLELLDERDTNGNPTGRVQARMIMHRSGMAHGTAHVWLIRPNGKSGYDLLLQKRSAGKDSFPGCYDISSAGHVPVGHDYLESALRELKEELGIEAASEELDYIGLHDGYDEAEFYGKPFLNHEISRVYLYRKPVDAGRLKLQREEIESVVWMDYGEICRGMEDGSLNHCLNESEIAMVGKALGLRG